MNLKTAVLVHHPHASPNYSLKRTAEGRLRYYHVHAAATDFLRISQRPLGLTVRHRLGATH